MYEPNDWVLRWTHKWWWGPSVFFWFLALSFFLIALILSAVLSSFPFWVVCLSLCVLSFVSFGSHSHLKSLFVFAEDTPWKFKLSLSSRFIFFLSSSLIDYFQSLLCDICVFCAFSRFVLTQSLFIVSRQELVELQKWNATERVSPNLKLPEVEWGFFFSKQ